MPNSNPQAVQFCNQYVRPMADETYAFYLTAKKFLQLWNSQNLAVVIPNDSQQVADGSATDGRPTMTDAQVNILQSNVASFVATFEASANLILNQTTVIQVNGQSRF